MSGRTDLFHETVYPASHFAAELLNVSEETMRELVTHGGIISHQAEALAGRDEFINLLDGTRTSPWLSTTASPVNGSGV